MAITIDLTGQVDGTFTIEDDGVPGNGTSVVRRPNGTILQTFVHPADSLTFISRAGQSIVVNITDSLTTANVTIGSLTVPASNPDNLSIGSLLTSGIVTLGARGAISELGSDAASDIIAGRLFMDAGSGIGVGNAIEMQVETLEAESVTGGINLSNTGALVIGGGALGTVNLRGLFTGTSGNITLINQGAITLSDDDGPESVHSAGNVTLSAIGSVGDISSNVNQDALFAVGNIFLNAGRDILFGRTGANFDNDVRAGGGIFITAARDFAIDGFSDMAADDQGQATGGGVTVTAGRDILIDDANGTDAGIAVSPGLGTGAITLTTGVGGTLLLHANSSAAIQGRLGGVTIRADRVLIESDSGINVSGSGTTTLTTSSAGREIIVGSATDGITALELSDVELDRIVTGSLTIGSADAGTLSVVGAISHTNNNLTLRTGSDLLVSANITTPQTLTLVSGESLSQGAASVLTTGTLTVNVDAPDADPAGANLNFAGGLTATTVLLNGNEDGDTINGTFFADTLAGFGGADTLRGFQGADILNGGAGADLMVGGTENDFYFADNVGDRAVEAVGEGTGDRVFASANFTLETGSEVEILSTNDNLGIASINLTGNAFGQFLFGNAGANNLDGGGGGDTMMGFGGNDFYFVRNAADRTLDGAGEGTGDRVFAAVSYGLEAAANIEILSTVDNLATTAINLTGNALSQFIFGNEGANTLDSGGGGDTMLGFGGDDFYFVRTVTDRAVEASTAGNDRVFAAVSFALEAGSHVEMLTTIDNLATTAINLVGNELANILFGNAGSNTLDGGGGNDTLVGLDGADTFQFSTTLGAGNVDSLSGFVVGQDKIALDDAVFTGLALGALPAGAFRTGNMALDADDRIIYDPASGALYFDTDGIGSAAAVHFATLSAGLALGAGDFTVI